MDLAKGPTEDRKAGRPPIPDELHNEVVSAVVSGTPVAEAVKQFAGRVGKTKVYEIYRYPVVKKAQGATTPLSQ